LLILDGLSAYQVLSAVDRKPGMRPKSTLMKGVVVRLSPFALSIKPGGAVERAGIRGGLTTHGPGIEPLELHGRIRDLIVDGGLESGGGFKAL
jgi:hypothetical protein